MRKGEERRMLDDLANKDINTSTWEDDFLISLSLQLELGNQLTPKQLTKLTEIYENHILGY